MLFFFFFLQVRNVFCMKAKEGRKKSVRALVAVGNGKGAAGMYVFIVYVFIVCMHLLYVQSNI